MGGSVRYDWLLIPLIFIMGTSSKAILAKAYLKIGFFLCFLSKNEVERNIFIFYGFYS
jgi:hypothetical protein